MEETGFVHVPVLVEEVLDALALKAGGTYVDCTAGGGGHSAAIARQLGPDGRLIALDQDPSAVAAASDRIAAAIKELPADARPAWEVVHTPFSGFGHALAARGVEPGEVDGVLADLGVSSPQLDRPERGFSFADDGPLDMRMDPTAATPTAADLVATLDERALADALYRLADERDSRRIARAIAAARAEGPITTTARLAEVVSDAVGGRRGRRIHPATRTFQALRLLVNREPDELDALLDVVPRWLRRPGGRFAVITFHSGEDRPVKRAFAALSSGCVCPPSAPVCVCGKTPAARRVGGKGWTATAAETDANPRARTARLRVVEMLEDAGEQQEA